MRSPPLYTHSLRFAAMVYLFTILERVIGGAAHSLDCVIE